ncbi:MFS transporter [uncultured Lactobacillus sp.]|uniref:MFS transporter n=1 Tax=uncultured Lactobacillus sp. TaxID=153152 RepID=UPI002613B6E9|nr:MFS transporter [uncultured Lactobacillus sp.]
MTASEKAIIKQWKPRYKRNVYLYLWIYGILGAVTGITNDAALSYFDIVAPHLISGLNIFNAITALLMSLMIVTVHDFGYRKILLVLPPLTSIFLFLTTVTQNQVIIMLSYIISWTAIGVYDLMYPLMWTSYVPKEIRTKMFTVVMVVNLVCQTILTFVGGKAVVWLFSLLQGISYDSASALSAHPQAMQGIMLTNYTNAYRWVLIATAIFNMLAFFLAFFIKDEPKDYRTVDKKKAETPEEKRAAFKALINKDTLMWIAYIAGIQLGARLVVPYIPIYLNDFLHIPRGITSTINTFQTAAMFIGYFFAPFLAKKLGAIVSIAAGTLTCAPLMFMMANGRNFGTGVTLFITVGVLLFLRSGLANATMPIQQEVQMVIVDKDMRPAFTAVVQIAYAAIGIVDGLFTEFYLLRKPIGYSYAYYIATALYIIVSIILLIVFTKKYNWILDVKKTKAKE